MYEFVHLIKESYSFNADDVLTADFGISAYSSASSSNINPFSGASGGEDDDDEFWMNGA